MAVAGGEGGCGEGRGMSFYGGSGGEVVEFSRVTASGRKLCLNLLVRVATDL